MNHAEELKVRVILEQIEIDATCPDCGHLSMAAWTGSGHCPHCHIETIRSRKKTSPVLCKSATIQPKLLPGAGLEHT